MESPEIPSPSMRLNSIGLRFSKAETATAEPANTKGKSLSQACLVQPKERLRTALACLAYEIAESF